MDILGMDVLILLLAGALVWSLLMLAVQMGQALSEAVNHRGR
jgi:hypothetical protein